MNTDVSQSGFVSIPKEIFVENKMGKLCLHA